MILALIGLFILILISGSIIATDDFKIKFEKEFGDNYYEILVCVLGWIWMIVGFLILVELIKWIL